MHQQQHKLIYAEDILHLNAANRRYSSEAEGKPRLFAIALPPGVPEVKRFETSRSVIFENVRLGFAAAYDALVEDRSLSGKGYEVAKQIWPDSVLLEVPTHLGNLRDESDLPPDFDTFDVRRTCFSSVPLSFTFRKLCALLQQTHRKYLPRSESLLRGDPLFPHVSMID